MKARTVEHVTDLRRRAAVPRPVSRVVPARALGELATSTAEVPPGSDVELEAVAEASGADVVLTGTVSFTWEGECRRCLQTVTGRVSADVREIFQDRPVEGETWPIQGEAIDLAPVLRDAVLLALPLVPLCADDCAGPDPDRFPTRIEDEGPTDADPDRAEDDGPPVDPRWAALDDLRFD